MSRSFNLVLLVFVIVSGLFVGGCGNDTKQFTLTIHVQGEGSVEPTEGKHRFDPKAVVDLTATPSIGWIFKEWIGVVTDAGAATTTVLMEGDKEITAVFEFPAVEGPPPGEKKTYTAQGVEFHMRLAPASTFPIGIDDGWSVTVDHNFWIAETPVTYELWYEVRMWALDNGYTFANAGMEGSITGSGDYPNYNNIGEPPTAAKREPATMISWYDSIVWCNALSQMLGYDPVYTINSVVIKSATGIDHTSVVAENNNGFRLPTDDEWELAARYKGSDSSYRAIEYPSGSGNYWTPGSYASGAMADYSNAAASQAAAWYRENSDVDGSGGKTHDVGQKPSGGNGLGVFDMSGNVWEWCFTLIASFDPRRVSRGGSWGDYAYLLRVGYVYGNAPGDVYNFLGLRFLRTNF